MKSSLSVLQVDSLPPELRNDDQPGEAHVEALPAAALAVHGGEFEGEEDRAGLGSAVVSVGVTDQVSLTAGIWSTKLKDLDQIEGAMIHLLILVLPWYGRSQQ